MVELSEEKANIGVHKVGLTLDRQHCKATFTESQSPPPRTSFIHEHLKLQDQQPVLVPTILIKYFVVNP